MRRFWASLGSLLFFIVAPGTILGLVPWWLTYWRIGPPFFGIAPLRWVSSHVPFLSRPREVLEVIRNGSFAGLPPKPKGMRR